jgi:hypothetical protein
MKLFDVDWAMVLQELHRWDALSLPARRILLDELRTHGYVPASRFGPHLDAIVASGIAAYEPDKRRLWLEDDRRPLVKVLRAMGRHRFFHVAPEARGDLPASNEAGDRGLHASLLRYMEEHFTGDEVQRIASAALQSRVYANRTTLAPFVSYSAWVGDLIGATDNEALLAWAESHGLNSAVFIEKDVNMLLDLQALVRTLLAFPDGIPLRNLLPRAQDDISVASAGTALHAGLATMTLFAGMRAEDLEPTVGLWPTVVRELTRPPSGPAAPVEVHDTFALAVHMEDMTTLLGAIAASPVRVRANDGAVFARTRADIEKRFVAPPPWVANLLAEDRVNHAAGELRVRDFVLMRDVDGNPHLHATAAGTHWLALSARGRLAALVDPLRKSKDKNPRDAYVMDRSLSFFPYSLPYYRAPKEMELRGALTRTFLQAADGFLPIGDFLEHATRNDNPLFTLAEHPAGRQELIAFSGHADPRGSARELWGQMLSGFFSSRLLGLGGATVGLHESGKICFKLTDVGRYLLGAADTFDYGSDEAADVVIQPNFDVVFMGAAPSVEAELARFSERVGVAPGRVFRITRQSVLAAAESGAGVGDVIGALARASSKPVPKNVQHEIAGWMGTVRRATSRRTELLECADADVATRIVALLGSGVRQLTPVILELPDLPRAARASMLKKLRAGGVFIDEHRTRPDAPL